MKISELPLASAQDIINDGTIIVNDIVTNEETGEESILTKQILLKDAVGAITPNGGGSGSGITYTAGQNISIDNGVISADLSGKQDILTAGTGIEINNNIISTIDNNNKAINADWNENNPESLAYIENKPFGDNESLEVLFNQTIDSFDSNGSSENITLDQMFTPNVGDTYTVFWDDVPYDCKVTYVYEDFRSLGNEYPNGDWSEFPFRINFQLDGEEAATLFVDINNSSVDSHSVKICKKISSLKTLETKYLPEHLQFGEKVIKVEIFDSGTSWSNPNNYSSYNFFGKEPASIYGVEIYLNSHTNFPIDGNKYDVIINGNKYSTTAFTYGSSEYMLYNENDKVVMHYLYIQGEEERGLLFDPTFTENYSDTTIWSIEYTVDNGYKPINAQYLPKYLQYGSSYNEEFLLQNSIYSNGNQAFTEYEHLPAFQYYRPCETENNTIHKLFEIGNKYKVIVGDHQYEVTCVELEYSDQFMLVDNNNHWIMWGGDDHDGGYFVNLCDESFHDGNHEDELEYIINKFVAQKIPISSLPIMSGATSEEDGAAGIVPAPKVEDADKVLKGDGTWVKHLKSVVVYPEIEEFFTKSFNNAYLNRSSYSYQDRYNPLKIYDPKY